MVGKERRDNRRRAWRGRRALQECIVILLHFRIAGARGKRQPADRTAQFFCEFEVIHVHPQAALENERVIEPRGSAIGIGDDAEPQRERRGHLRRRAAGTEEFRRSQIGRSAIELPPARTNSEHVLMNILHPDQGSEAIAPVKVGLLPRRRRCRRRRPVYRLSKLGMCVEFWRDMVEPILKERTASHAERVSR